MGLFSRNIVKESIDNLPSGICFFDENGLMVLCNRKMHQLFYEMTGKELQMERDVILAMKHLEKDIYTSKDHVTWYFTKECVVDRNNTQYQEYLATNITQLHETIHELEQKQKDLSTVLKNMEQINKEVISIAREEEILSARIKVHNEIGGSILRTRQYYLSGMKVEEKQQLLEHWEKTLSHLLGNDEDEVDQDIFDEFQYVVDSIGAELILEGEMPKEREAEQLIVSAMRECLTNLIRHAKGKKLFVKIEEAKEELTVVLTNDGMPPKEKIVEGGGLSTLRNQIEMNGGKMEIQSFPEFKMTLVIPFMGDFYMGVDQYYEKYFDCR